MQLDINYISYYSRYYVNELLNYLIDEEWEGCRGLTLLYMKLITRAG